ncbi:alpha-tubulin N-acetyltransferase 1 isoform X2 [Corythoichthys intestinalis]|uniref:alpha-tubulin N-acetyltransferase 1 isoform X2 n=1 Tax=Corythoichthys intestinalis TaxID=161448 RepID=UPI0025A655CF|nr:alpha-tubulin N-acetyltransferase 1 isoform X2 [Corythoichthys intestinalis]
MEFSFNVNLLFPERFSILDKSLVSGRASPNRPDLQSHVATVIDELGRASAKAQKLTTPVTTAAKLQSQNHQLYLMKDGESNGGCGTIVGFLKVGFKKLFLLDRQGLHIEDEPLCVLDFFIVENLQRKGYGLELFNFMLQDKNLEPVLMAYDRPSPKLLSFLAKHYSLTQSVPQVNHFVVFDGFFLNKPGSARCPLTDQGMYGFFGPIENDSPKKARRRDQTLFHNGERSCPSGAEEPSVAVCPSPQSPAVGILPQRGILPYQDAPSVSPNVWPWGTQEPESELSSHRTIQGKTHQFPQ